MKSAPKAKSAQGLRVPFAYSGAGILIEPSAAEEGGVFRCPGCNGGVRRRRSSRGRLHFYHRDPRDEQETCGETALHLAAKAILEKSNTLRLPELRLSIPSPTEGPVNVYPGGTFVIEKAELEVSLENRERVVDVVLSGNASPPLGQKVYIEICVTNPVIGERKNWFRKWNVPAVEISLCRLKDLEFNALNAALNHPANQRWIHHPNYRTILAEAREALRLSEDEHRKTVAAQAARDEAKRRQKQETLERRQRLQARVYEEFRAKHLPPSEDHARKNRWDRQLRLIKENQFPIALAIAATHPYSLQPESRWIIKQRASADSPSVWLMPCIKALAYGAPYSIADLSTVRDLARRAEIGDADAFHLLASEIDVDAVTAELANRGRNIARDVAERQHFRSAKQIEVENEQYQLAKKSAAAINGQNRLRENARRKAGMDIDRIERWVPCSVCFDKKSVRWSKEEKIPNEVTCHCTNAVPVPNDILEKDV